ncbi:MAG: FtsW/RodA/SpoVE family cell cycle protein [Selenomonas sp.]|nr:FtsW/RodA/SpoVE family cell cycle protein [Selenomonas sp.]
MPLGILLAGLGVLCLKGHAIGAAGKVLESAVLPYLLVCLAEIIILQFLLWRKKYDIILLPLVLMLCSVGLVEIARLKPELLVQQLRWLCVAQAVLMLLLRFWKQIREMLSYPYLLGLTCVVVLGLPMLFGTEIGGSRNWLVFGPFSLQPSEFGKILILFFLAAYLSDHRHVLSLPSMRLGPLCLPPLRFIAPLVCIWGAAVLMFVVEKDLGSALLFFGMAVLMTYMATGSKTYVFLALLFISLAAGVSYLAFGHVRVRFDIWLDPWQDPNGMAYQVVQSLFSFGTGGVWGTGFGFGHPDFIPEVHTDFIYAAIGEEWGLIGSLSVLFCYVLLAFRGISIALQCEEDRELMLAAGCSMLLLLQAFVIIAGVTKFLPLTGITLPFVSYGGSSLVSGFIELGLLLALSRGKQERGKSRG